MTQTRILWLARHLPVPLNAGDRIYTARLVESLARAGADVHYLGLANPQSPDVGPDELDPRVTWEIIPGKPVPTTRAVFSRRTVVAKRFGTPAYEARLRSLLASERYDAVVLDQYAMSWTIPLIEALPADRRPAIVHVAHDFETDVIASIARNYRGNPVRKLAFWINAKKTALAERALAQKSALVVALTQTDCDLFAGIGAHGEMLVLPPGYDGPRLPARVITETTPRRVCILGSYHWAVKQFNLSTFLEACDDRFTEAGIALDVIGEAPEEYVAQWQAATRSVKFRGFVDDLDVALDGYRMGLVIEAVGGGFKLKVLDYVMRRAPVAALTPALTGQEPSVVANFLVRDTGAELVDAIIATIDDIDALNRMHDGAFAAAARFYDWDSNGAKLLAAIKRVAGRAA